MIRVLIVDDGQKLDFIDEMRREIAGSFEGSEIEIIHINPANLLDDGTPREALQGLLNKVELAAEEFWDVVVIDINLADVKLPEEDKIHLPLSIAEKVRFANKSATVALYSGTLADHVGELLKGDRPPEVALKRIFRAEIASFVPRNRVVQEVLSSLDNPSWFLRLDRLLMVHAALQVDPQEAEFKGKSFAQLAKSVRSQNVEGQKLTQLVAEYGISSFADLNSPLI